MPQNRRVQYTCNALRSAMLLLLQQKPISSITVTDLCAAADINRSTFYLHYQDVYALLREIEEHLLEEVQHACREMPVLEELQHACQHTTEIAQHNTLLAMLRVIQKNRTLCCAILDEHGDPQFIERLSQMSCEKFVELWRVQFPHATERRLMMIYTFSSHGSAAIMTQWLQDGCPESAEDIAELLGTFARGCLHSSIQLCKP